MFRYYHYCLVYVDKMHNDSVGKIFKKYLRSQVIIFNSLNYQRKSRIILQTQIRKRFKHFNNTL